MAVDPLFGLLRPGPGGLPVLPLATRDGARAEVCLHGAHVISWLPAGGNEDRLFLSSRSRFGPGASIRGGVPVAFPQFADQGTLQPHGFARNVDWTLVEAEPPRGTALLQLESSPETLAGWPHRFRLGLRIRVEASTLALALTVWNNGDAPFAFTGALHTYLRVRDVGRVAIRGFAGTRYRDKVTGANDALEAGEAIAIASEIDRVYHASPERVLVEEPGRRLAVSATGFPDTVIWNPGPKRAADMDDMEPGGQQRMVCVEAAVARAPASVAPGGSWHGTQTLTAM